MALVGLDPPSKKLLSSLLDQISSGHKSDGQLTTQVVLGLRRDDVVPDWISHILGAGEVHTLSQGPRETVENQLGLKTKRHPGKHILEKVYSLTTSEKGSTLDNPDDRREILVDVQDVRIAYRDKEILKDFSWKIRRGDRWGLFGPNGMTCMTNLV